MSVVRYYFDEHIPQAVAQGLRQAGVDVLFARDAGMMSAADEEHLALATSLGRVVYTNDQDFARLHAAGIAHAGIVLSRQSLPIRGVIDGLLEIFQVLTAEEMAGQLRFI